MRHGTFDTTTTVHKVAQDVEGNDREEKAPQALEDGPPGTPAGQPAPETPAPTAAGTPQPKGKAKAKSKPPAVPKAAPKSGSGGGPAKADVAAKAEASRLRSRYFAAVGSAQALLKTCETQWQWCAATPFHANVIAAMGALTAAAYEDQALREYLGNTGTLSASSHERFMALSEEIGKLEKAVQRLQAVGTSGEA